MPIIIRLLAGIGLLWVLVTATPLVGWWAGRLGGPWTDPGGDVLIVLAGSQLDEDLLGESSYWRSVYAVLAFRQGGFRQILFCGRGGPYRTSTAALMAGFVQAHGIPAEVVRLEERSGSTRENALYARELLASMPGRKVLLTSDYHMYRAVRVFRKAGVDVASRPFPDAGKRAAVWLGRWPAFLDLVRETGKIGYYWARGWL